MTSARRWSPYAWAALAILVVCWRIILFEMMPNHESIGPWSYLQIVKSYNYTILLSNYFTEGFVRRGVQGSLFYLLRGLRIEWSLILFHLFNALWLFVPLLILLRRLAQTPGRGWIWLLLTLGLAPQLLFAWAQDVARGDMLVGGFIAWAVLACLDRRYILAAVVIFIASQSHEIGLVYGGSLCFAIGVLDHRTGKVTLGHAAAALGVLGGLWALAVLGQHFLGPTPQAVARDMLANAPNASVGSYRAVYMTVGGFRTLTSSACMSFTSPSAYFYIASIYLVLALYGVVLPAFSRLRLLLLLFVGFLPMTVLTVLAIDYGRWLSFAVLNWWLMNAALQLRGVDTLKVERWPPKASMLAGVVVLAMGPGGWLAANFATVKVAERLWRGGPPAGNRLDLCDPTWTTVVSPTGKPSS